MTTTNNAILGAHSGTPGIQNNTKLALLAHGGINVNRNFYSHNNNTNNSIVEQNSSSRRTNKRSSGIPTA